MEAKPCLFSPSYTKAVYSAGRRQVGDEGREEAQTGGLIDLFHLDLYLLQL